MKDNVYVVATIKPWNIKQFYAVQDMLPGQWHLLTSPKELDYAWLEKVNPKYIFFPHWSWIVPSNIIKRWDCVCFHMADVPYGRGGSPLQNLIIHGHKMTKLSALKMIDVLDAGPVYKKIDLSLEGSAQQIFERIAPMIYELIRCIIDEEPEPQPQQGEVTIFPRRTPEQSRLPNICQLEELYNHIRMLDAESYPKAFLDYGNFKIEFDSAVLDETGSVKAQVVIRFNSSVKE